MAELPGACYFDSFLFSTVSFCLRQRPPATHGSASFFASSGVFNRAAFKPRWGAPYFPAPRGRPLHRCLPTVLHHRVFSVLCAFFFYRLIFPLCLEWVPRISWAPRMRRTLWGSKLEVFHEFAGSGSVWTLSARFGVLRSVCFDSHTAGASHDWETRSLPRQLVPGPGLQPDRRSCSSSF